MGKQSCKLALWFSVLIICRMDRMVYGGRVDSRIEKRVGGIKKLSSLSGVTGSSTYL